MPNNGSKAVAIHAITEFNRKMVVRAFCQKNELSFKKIWKLEKQKQLEKVKAIRCGVWKSRLSNVTFEEDPTPSNQKTKPIAHSFKKGRFTVHVSKVEA